MKNVSLEIYPLLKHIEQTPLWKELPTHKAKCPYCESKKLNSSGTTTTLLGGGTGPDNDPNHTWTTYDCRNCNKSFFRETKRGNVWYTEDNAQYKGSGVVLKGVPTCFEQYFYTHKNCGKRISLVRTELDGSPYTKCYISVSFDGAKNHKNFYVCECGFKVEVVEDHWYGYPILGPQMSKEQIEENMSKWKVEVEMDIGFVYAPNIPNVEIPTSSSFKPHPDIIKTRYSNKIKIDK